MSGQVSVMTLVGGGREAPGCAHSTCQMPRISASDSSSGRRLSALRVAAAITLASSRPPGISRAEPIDTLPGSTLSKTDIMLSGSDALDRERLEVGVGIGGIEDLAVEQAFLAARRGGRDLRIRHAERLGRLAPDVLAVDLVDERLAVGLARQ